MSLQIANTGRVLDVVHRVVCRHLAIKANPPTYDRLVDDLAGLLIKEAAPHEQAVADAVDDLADLTPSSSDPATVRRHADAIVLELQAELAKRGEAAAAAIAPGLGRTLAAAFALGRDEATADSGWSVGWTLEDQDAVHGQLENGLWWVGQHVGDPAIAAAVRDAVQVIGVKGMGRVEAGRVLAATLGQVYPRRPDYWRGFAATAATRSRSFGALTAFSTIGVVAYEYVNPLDERTSDVCRALNGTVFEVRGAVELRELLLSVKSPESWKAVAPWPRDTRAIAGMTPRELQAHGIAWPPLHFHCRSWIDAHQLVPIDEVLDGELPALEANPIPEVVKPPPRVRKPRTVDPERARLKALKEAERRWKAVDKTLRARKAGLDVAELPKSVAYDLKLYANRQAYEPSRPALSGCRWIDDKRARDRRIPVRGLYQLLRDLDAVPMGSRQPLAHAQLVSDLSELAALYTERQQAIRQWAALATDDEQQPLRLRLRDTIMQGFDKLRGSRRATEAAIDEALQIYSTDELALIALEGVTYRHDGGNSRAYAMAGNWIKPGTATQSMFELVVPVGSNQPLTPGTDPLKVDKEGRWVLDEFETRPHEQAVIAHELGHCLDGIHGSDAGQTGSAWTTRPHTAGMASDPTAAWRSTFGDTFEAAKDGSGRTVPLPWEPSGVSTEYWRGTWVDPYEARIYSGQQPGTSAIGSSKAGPIEFIAQAHTYLPQAAMSATRSLTDRSRRASPRAWQRFDTAMESKRGGREWRAARRLYGEAYTGGMFALHDNPGRRYLSWALRNAGDGVRFETRRDVYVTAVGWSREFGIPLEQLVGPGGMFERYLPAGFDPISVDQLQRWADAAAASPEVTGAADDPGAFLQAVETELKRQGVG